MVIHAQSYEYLQRYMMMAVSHALGKQVQHTLSILDMNNFGITSLNKQVYQLINSATGLGSANYPDNMGKTFIVNAPLLFTGCWKIIKAFLDEKTVEKVALHRHGTDELLEMIDEDVLLDFLGGKNTAKLEDNVGVWNDYDFFDGHTAGAVVGVRRKDDPNGQIFTPAMLEALPNPRISDEANAARLGA